MTDYSQHPEYLALLETIRTNPADDAPRWIISDWLEEHDQLRLAKFIRAQLELGKLLKTSEEHGNATADSPRMYELLDEVRELWGAYPQTDDPRMMTHATMPKNLEWFIVPDYLGNESFEAKALVSRGFVSEIRLNCLQFMGGKCERCDGVGREFVRGFESDLIGDDVCLDCKGICNIEGVAWELFQRHPITRVVLADKHRYDGNHCVVEGRFLISNPGSEIPKVLFGKLPIREMLEKAGSFASFGTKRQKDAALSEAAVAYGRELVGLPALEAN